MTNGKIEKQAQAETVAKLRETVRNLSTANLRVVVAGLFTHEDDAATDALGFALDELETRLPEAEFVAFCDSLE